jgi:alanine dehydrogenase
LTNATLSYVLALAEQGVHRAVAADPGLKKGVNLVGGQVTYPSVAEAVGLDYVDHDDALAAVTAG